MKLGEIYELAVRVGREADPRDAERIDKELALEKKHYEGLKEKERELYKERMADPIMPPFDLYKNSDDTARATS